MNYKSVFFISSIFILSLYSSCSPSSSGENNSNNNTNNSNCTSNLSDCNGVCVDLMNDNNNCGSCGNICNSDEVCNGNGSCTPSGCEDGTIDCGGVCADPLKSPNHCGNCFHPCGQNEICDNGTCVDNSCSESVSEAHSGLLPADIIVVVDNSGSMTDEAISVQASMNDFVGTLTASNIDAHVILISADSGDEQGICVPSPLGSGACPADENLPEFRHVVQSVGSSNALDLILSTYSLWSDSLRPSSSKTILVISDDNSGLGATSFTNSLIALDPSFEGFKFSGIIAPYDMDDADCVTCQILGTCNTSSCDQCCGMDTSLNLLCTALPASEGTVYKELIQSTGGVEGNLCIQDFHPAFQDLATAVISESEVDCLYDIPDPGNGQAIDYNMVNVDYQESESATAIPIYNVPGGIDDCGTEGGWYYNENDPPDQVLLCPSTCETVQANLEAKISVKFGCETIIQ